MSGDESDITPKNEWTPRGRHYFVNQQGEYESESCDSDDWPRVDGDSDDSGRPGDLAIKAVRRHGRLRRLHNRRKNARRFGTSRRYDEFRMNP